MAFWLRSRRPRINPGLLIIIAAVLVNDVWGEVRSKRVVELPPGPVALHLRVHAAMLDPKCGRVTGVGAATSLPIPVDGPPKGYHVYFYPVVNPHKNPEAWAPAGVATLPLEGLEALSCKKIERVSKKVGSIVSAGADKLGSEEYDARRDALCDLTEEAAKAYFLNSSGPKAKALAGKYLAEFEFLSEPGLRDTYDKANPGFWKWVRSAAGRGEKQ